MGRESIAGRYRLVEPTGSSGAPSGALGVGGSGAVFEAWDTTLERKVAIKRLLPEQDSPELRELFLRETRILERVRHPGVVELFDVGEDDRGPFMVMELCTGETLAARLRARGPQAPSEVRALARTIAGALGALHEVGLVHRDVKPANVIFTTVDGGERPKLVDLGVARARDHKTISKPGELIGTALYASPEQIKEEPVDGRADLYSLGVVMFEALEGTRPFDGTTLARLVFAHVHQAPPPFTRLVPNGLEAIVRRCLEKEPSLRFASAQALIEALDATAANDEGPPAFMGELVLDAPPAPKRGALAEPEEPPPAPPLELAEPSAAVGPSAPRPSGPPCCAECGAELASPTAPCASCGEGAALAPLSTPALPQTPIVRRPLAAPVASTRRDERAPLTGALPGRTFRNLAWGAGLMGALLYPVLHSPLWLGLCGAVALYGLIGYLRQRDDGSLD